MRTPSPSQCRPIPTAVHALLLLSATALMPASAHAASGSFSRSSAAPGETVTLSGKAKPRSSMSAYFYCDSGCGETHVGAVSADAKGNYTLTFKVPAQAKPGPAYLSAGCDSCGNGWSQFPGLTVSKGVATDGSTAGKQAAAPAQPAQPARPAPPKDPNNMIFKLANGGERCFGAIGNSCSDQATDKSIPKIDYGRVGIKPDYTVTAAVSVGSILHDNCCRSNPQGLYCSGINWGSVLTDVASLTDFPAAIWNLQRSKGGDSVACAKEWRKAVYDILDTRFWYESFGPYRDDEKADDTTRQYKARVAKLPGRFGVRDSVTDYSGIERGETIRLKAPSGTRLEIYDVQFCASGAFREEGWCSAGALCSGSVELAQARQAVRNWEDWRSRKQKEAEKFWPVDPRRAAIAAEITVAEADHAAKAANVARLEAIFNTRNSHWGICR